MIRVRIATIFILMSAALLLAGCGQQGDAGQEEAQPEEAQTEAESEADAVSTASVVDTADGFIRAASSDGTWIIAITQDLTVDSEIVVAGEFTRRDEIYRKLALYAQDEDRNITDRYTLTAPRLVVRSENTRIEEGTFVGDVYIEAPGFHLVGATVEGNVYFETEALRDSFEMDDASEVTGEIRIGTR